MEPLCARLLRVGDVPGLRDVGPLCKAALVSLASADCSRREAFRFLTAELSSEEVTFTSRALVLDVLGEAAQRLSNQFEPEEVPRARKQLLPPEPVEAPAKGPATRRFASATRIPASRPNKFAAELRHVLLPLVASWRQLARGRARAAAGEASLVSSLLQCVGTLLQCGGTASPDRDAAAEAALALAEPFLSHQDPLVRRCSLFVLSRVLLVGADALVMSHPLLLEQIQLVPLRDGDDTCRRMAGGVLAWLYQQHSLAGLQLAGQGHKAG